MPSFGSSFLPAVGALALAVLAAHSTPTATAATLNPAPEDALGLEGSDSDLGLTPVSSSSALDDIRTDLQPIEEEEEQAFVATADLLSSSPPHTFVRRADDNDGKKKKKKKNKNKCSRKRKEWGRMSQDEKDLYLRAVSTLASRGSEYWSVLFDHQVVSDDPALMQFTHNSVGFIPWHRAFLVEFERQLQGLGGEFRCVTIPYWDWSVSSSNIWGSSGYQDFSRLDGRGCVASIGRYRFSTNLNWMSPSCVDRTSPAPQRNPIVSAQQLYTMVANANSIDQLFAAIFQPHSTVHVNVGGYMGILRNSGYDPLFMIHHAFMDYLWWEWSRCHGTNSVGSLNGVGLSGLSRIRASANTIARAENWGYTYQRSAYAKRLFRQFPQLCPSGRRRRDTDGPSTRSTLLAADNATATSEFDSELAAYGRHLALHTNEHVNYTYDGVCNALKATCEELGTVMMYTECSTHAKNMCSCVQELESARRNPCMVEAVVLPGGADGSNKDALTLHFAHMDQQCREEGGMMSMGGMMHQV